MNKAALFVSAMTLTLLTTAADAQHFDALVARQGNQVVLGGLEEGGAVVIGTRVFEAELDESFASTDPGFNAVAQGSLPAGTSALPANAAVTLAIVPETIGGATRNLFYWNGVGDVEFGAAPAGSSLLVQRLGPFTQIAADGSNSTLANFPLMTTSDTGTIHFHPNYQLDRTGSAVVAGFYLLPFEVSVPGLSASDTGYIVFNAGGLDEGLHEDAIAWVETNVVPEPASVGILAAAGLTLLGRRNRKGR
jgi:hypothetical protein